jgi:hypothetical protein
MDTNRDWVIGGLLEDIADISDKEYQQRVWVRGEGPECDDFTEIVCRFFHKADIFIQDPFVFNLSDIQVEVLKNFIKEFEQFSDANDLPQLFIDTPEWTRITLMAKEVLQVFGYQK